MKTRLCLVAGILLAIVNLAIADGPPVAPIQPVTDDYFGVRITDPYRYMENLSDPKVLAWMKAQAAYTRATLDRIPVRAAILADVLKYVNSAPATVGSVRRTASGQIFFMKTLAGQSLAKLYVRDGLDGADRLLVDTEQFKGPHGEPPAINYYEPSWDAKLVAFGVSQGGSEDAVIHVVDVATGKLLPDAIDRGEFGGVSWRPDNQSFFYTRLQKLGPGSSPIQKYQDSKVYLHELGHDADEDVLVLGIGQNPRIELDPVDSPGIATQPGTDYAIAWISHGVQREAAVYAAPLDTVGQSDTPWVKVCDMDADVTDLAIHGNQIYLLTHKDAPRFEIEQAVLSNPTATTLLLPQTAGVLHGIAAAADGLYVTELDGGVYHLLRIPYGGQATQVTLPFEGTVGVADPDIRLPGVVLGLTSWVKGPRYAIYDPQTNQVTPTDLQPAGPYDNVPDLTSLEVKAPSYDQTLVPLSIVLKKGTKLDGKNPTYLGAYGAYGITQDPSFGPALLAWLNRGGIYCIAHVRGGGEGGEQWYKAGYKLTKPNTWRDMIACAQYLIDQKYTSPAYLGISGGSAGGITVGRFITERPDLVAAAVISVGVENILRSETYANGLTNVPEFGSIKTVEGFEDLYAMDAYLHVRDGVAYPAVMLTTGVNDPRVAPWMPAKMAARLQAATSSGNPILLRVDFQGGHGIGASKQQRAEQTADTMSFFLWRFGMGGK